METLKNRLLDIIKTDDDIRKRIGIVAVLTDALKDYNVTPVIVGGFAVELWTMGKYATLDVDLVAEGISETAPVLYDLGFKNRGGVWTYPGSDVIIEFPKPPLDGDYNRLQPLDFDGNTVYLLGIEDILLDRVSALKHWRDESSREWAVFLAAAHFEKIDWMYCEKKAIEKQIDDELQLIKISAAELLKS